MSGPERPRIAITMGDPGGVGPEIIVKALMQPDAHAECSPFVVGDANVLSHVLAERGDLNCAGRVQVLENLKNFSSNSDTIPILDMRKLKMTDYRPGQVQKSHGAAAGAYIERGVELVTSGQAQALVTAPINKEALALAGYKWSGHTDMLRDLAGVDETILMLMVDHFRVVHVTLHMSLKAAIKSLTTARVERTIDITAQGLKSFGIRRPRIAVAGLNPHAGEHGLFGSEDSEIIQPAIAAACQRGHEVAGPFPPDTIFSMMRGGRFDVVVTMYHDQGGIPMKLLAQEWNPDGTVKRFRGVNVTLGLPFVRTSVAHGTGFEIAGQGTADATSLQEAIQTARVMLASRALKES